MPASSTRNQPSIERPRISNRRTCSRRTSRSVSSGSTRTRSATLPAGAHRHVAADEEREPAEHAPLGDPALLRHELPDAVGQRLVERHAPSVPMVRPRGRFCCVNVKITAVIASFSGLSLVEMTATRSRRPGRGSRLVQLGAGSPMIPTDVHERRRRVGPGDGPREACVDERLVRLGPVSVVIKIDHRSWVTDGLSAPGRARRGPILADAVPPAAGHGRGRAPLQRDGGLERAAHRVLEQPGADAGVADDDDVESPRARARRRARCRARRRG